MKSTHLTLLLAAALCPAALFLPGCSKAGDSPTFADKTIAEGKTVAADAQVGLTNSWDAVRNYGYEKRSEFSASVDRMAGRLDDRSHDLRTRVAASPTTASKDWASATREYDAARADLNARLSDLNGATADTWADAKEKTAQAWTNLQAAFAKMKSSVTS